MKEHNFNRSKLADIMTFDEAVMLEKLYMDSQKNFPYPIPFNKLYSLVKTKSNLTTRVIVDFMKWMPKCNARRINTTGIPQINKRTKKVTGWIPSGAEKGVSDIIGSINGRIVNIEVKDKDQQLDSQIAYQKRVEDAGEIYIIVHNFTEFYYKFKQLNQ